jgi:FtsP/CotA-like multicopper oxidase with cupredoxin domain
VKFARRHVVTIGAVAAAIVIAGIVYASTREEAPVEFAGMEMSQDELRDMTRDSMDAASMSAVDEVEPGDRAAELSHRVEDGVKVFRLSATPLRWEYRTDQSVAAWGYEQQIPGPAIHVTEGDRVRVEFTNNLPEPTTVHWHGVDVPFEQDGVPGISQDAIEPGESFTYEFAARPAGTRFYHTHGSSMRDEARQIDMGLSGPLIIDAKSEPKVQRDYTLVLDEWLVEAGGLNAAMMSGAGHAAHNAGYNVFTINGRAAPDYEPLRVKRGDKVRLRLINAGSSTTHPMHLHGHQFTVIALDGNPVPAAAQQERNVLAIAPGETADVLLTADNPGAWMLHCHELHHADAGMMTLFQYDGALPVSDADNAAVHGGDH